MNANDYSKRALKLDRNYDAVSDRLSNDIQLLRMMHGAIGLCGESGETADMIKKCIMYGKPIEVEKLKKECGDVLWYMAVILDAMNSSFEEVMQMNIDKLESRYPEGFTEAAAIERKDSK